MGAWGAGIFSNDIASDMRGDWREGILAGEDPVELSRRLEALADGVDEAEVCEAWTGLALAQHETGRLQPAVRDRALAVIEAGGDVQVYDDGTSAPVRRRSLDSLARKLRGPQPHPKRLRGPRAPIDPGVAVGDVLRLWSADRARSRLVVVIRQFLVENATAVELLGLYCPGDLPTDAAGWAEVPYLVGLDFSAFDWQHKSPPDYHLHYAPVCATAVFVRRPADAFSPHLGEVVARDVRRTPFWEVGDYSSWDWLIDVLDHPLATPPDRMLQLHEEATRRTMADFPEEYAGVQARLSA